MPRASILSGRYSHNTGVISNADGVNFNQDLSIERYLQDDGYKTAIYLHAPGADVAAVRDLAETRGLAFVAIETTPEKLADAVEQVNKATAEKSARPGSYPTGPAMGNG